MQKINYLINRFSSIATDEGLLTAIHRLYLFFIRIGKIKVSTRSDYKTWIKLYDKKNSQQKIKAIAQGFGFQPLISVVMPVGNASEKLLNLAMNSVVNQVYINWELYIVDDASTAPDVKQILRKYALADPRIKLVLCDCKTGVSAALNRALELVTGDYVAFLGHHDQLSTNALFYVVEELNKHPELALIYSDEDSISERGVRFNPHFKTDWNPDLFYSLNYISHLAVYKRGLIKESGGFRVDYEGAHEYDLAIRSVALISAENIRHIPRILYHQGVISGQVEHDTAPAGLIALKNYFGQVNPQISVGQGLLRQTYRIKYPIPSPEPKVSLIIPTRNANDLVKICIDSILEKTNYSNYEIILVDNQSDDPVAIAYFAELQKHKKITVLKFDSEFNYSSINNFAVQHARGDIVGLINNDIEVIEPEWLTEMVSHAVRREIGVVGAKLLYANGKIQHAGVVLGLGGCAGHSHKNYERDDSGYFSRLQVVQNYSAVTAACILVRKELYQQVGGLDEVAFKVAFNDVDFCLKIREAGFRNIWTPYALLYHHESATRGAENTPEKITRATAEIAEMKNRWASALSKDPFYNPNLTIAHENFAIAFPPRVY